MSDERAQTLAQLKQLYESGVLNEAAYRAALAALDAQAQPARKRGVKARKIRGNVATGDNGGFCITPRKGIFQLRSFQ
jgi:hypothetical protein